MNVVARIPVTVMTSSDAPISIIVRRLRFGGKGIPGRSTVAWPMVGCSMRGSTGSVTAVGGAAATFAADWIAVDRIAVRVAGVARQHPNRQAI